MTPTAAKAAITAIHSAAAAAKAAKAAITAIRCTATTKAAIGREKITPWAAVLDVSAVATIVTKTGAKKTSTTATGVTPHTTPATATHWQGHIRRPSYSAVVDEIDVINRNIAVVDK